MYYQSFIPDSSLPSHAKLSPTPPAPALYNFSGLGKLAQDPGFVREMQQMFVDRVPNQLLQVAAAIEEEQWETTARLAHSLKASFGNLRMEPGASLLKQLETKAKHQGAKQELAAMLDVITTTAEAVVRAFRDELSRTA